MKTKLRLICLAGAFLLSLGVTRRGIQASDHDDGETDTKGRSVNLTDLYVFREDWHTGATADKSNLVFIMNVSPRSVPRQQYYFSTNALYTFHVTRVPDLGVRPTGADNIALQLQFGSPDLTTSRQPVTFTTIVDGAVSSVSTTKGGTSILTSSLTDGLTNTSASLQINTVKLGAFTFRIFAGMREDPFFFDVERYFQIRSQLLGGPAAPSATTQTSTNPFRSDGTAKDFAKGYNVNSIVVEVPIAFLQKAGETGFDVWETVSVPQ